MDSNIVCVFCGLSGDLIAFASHTSVKVNEILKIRNTLKLQSKLITNVNDSQYFHMKCYRSFTSLSQKYVKKYQDQVRNNENQLNAISEQGKLYILFHK